MPTGRLRTAEIPLSNPSRVRAGKEITKGLGLVYTDKSIEFIGFFRRPGELICAPADTTVAGKHPLAPFLDRLPDESDDPALSVRDLPPVQSLVLPDRLVSFKAQWTKEQNQIDLQIGVELARELGYNAKADANLIYARVRGRLLVLMSSSVYAEAFGAPL